LDGVDLGGDGGGCGSEIGLKVGEGGFVGGGGGFETFDLGGGGIRHVLKQRDLWIEGFDLSGSGWGNLALGFGGVAGRGQSDDFLIFIALGFEEGELLALPGIGGFKQAEFLDLLADGFCLSPGGGGLFG